MEVSGRYSRAREGVRGHDWPANRFFLLCRSCLRFPADVQVDVPVSYPRSVVCSLNGRRLVDGRRGAWKQPASPRTCPQDLSPEMLHTEAPIGVGRVDKDERLGGGRRGDLLGGLPASEVDRGDGQFGIAPSMTTFSMSVWGSSPLMRFRTASR